MSKFILSAESTIDMPYSYAEERDIKILFYSYLVDGVEYVDDMGRDPSALPNFYKMLDEGKMAQTSQINEFTYLEYFENLIKEGDVLHICFGTGMTSSYNNAVFAAKRLEEEYPDRKLIVIDSLCSSSGYGLLTHTAANMRDEEKSIEEVSEWIMAERAHVHHQFFSTDLKFYKRSGRISGAAATVGAILNICPIMNLNSEGKIIAYDKVRGKKAAMLRTVSAMADHAVGGENYDGDCFICHSNCLDIAENLKDIVKEHFPKVKEIRICDIGTIIASHCGPGTVAVFFFGDDRVDH